MPSMHLPRIVAALAMLAPLVAAQPAMTQTGGAPGLQDGVRGTPGLGQQGIQDATQGGTAPPDPLHAGTRSDGRNPTAPPTAGTTSTATGIEFGLPPPREGGGRPR